MNPFREPRRTNRLAGILGLLALACCAAGAAIDRPAFFAAWLAGWWTCAGMVLGAQANLWLHGLTGGAWARTIRRPMERMAGAIPVLSVLALPLFLAIPFVYPWAHPGWADELKRPQFKMIWLSPGFFAARLAAYLIIWNLLIWLSGRGPRGSGKGYGAFGLLAFGYTVSLAGTDLIMSLMPQWYSSGFGLLIGTAQMKAAFALAVFCGARPARPNERRDLGNLLLMYVLMWAYLAFVQFQIIWAENLPHEIAWYVPRMFTGWRWLGVILIAAGFFLPLILLLFRAFKDSGARLQGLAALLCVMSFAESIWLVMPSIAHLNGHVVWMSPLAVAGMGAVLWATSPRIAWPGRGRSDEKDRMKQGAGHARIIR